MDILKRHVPDGSNEYQKTAVQFEENIYTVATSQSDYLRKISLWALSLETEAQPELNASLPNHNQINAASSMLNQMQQNQMLLQQAQQQSLMLGRRGASNINNMQRNAVMLYQQWQQQRMLSLLQSQQHHTSIMQQREMQMQQQHMQEFSAQLQMQNNNAFDSEKQQQQQFIPQQKQPRQQILLQDFSSSPASIDLTAHQAFHPGDWQQEMYQKLKYLKETYFGVLREIHQKLSIKLSQLDSVVPPDSRGAQIEKMKHFKVLLERIMTVLSLDKDNLQIDLIDKIPLYEKQILCISQNYERVHQQQ